MSIQAPSARPGPSPKQDSWAWLKSAGFVPVAVSPVLYALLVPLAVLDAMLGLYQRACFGVYGMGRVRRSDYLVFDRGLLPYLNSMEKLNCAYCSYANGVIAYAREVAARTEERFCPIKHSRRPASSHARYGRFAEYGDEAGLRGRRAGGRP